jgi:hypothetical protein
MDVKKTMIKIVLTGSLRFGACRFFTFGFINDLHAKQTLKVEGDICVMVRHISLD